VIRAGAQQFCFRLFSAARADNAQIRIQISRRQHDVNIVASSGRQARQSARVFDSRFAQGSSASVADQDIDAALGKLGARC